MANNALAAAELAVFLGFAAWLFYSQRTSSGRSGKTDETGTPPPDSSERRERADTKDAG